jgi:hypothetical protein
MAPTPSLPCSAPSSPIPSSVSTLGPTATSPAHLQAPRSSSLSPDDCPFLPLGQSKSQRWVDSTPSESSDEESPLVRAFFCDVLLSLPAPS